MMRHRHAPATVLAAAALLSGCANDGPRVGSTDKVQTTVETLLRLCASKDGPGVYDTLAEDTRRRFIAAGGVLEGCSEVLRLTDPSEVPSTELYHDARVASVDRRGDQATAVVEAGGRRTRVHLLDTGLQWFVSNPPRYEPAGVDGS